MSEPMPARFSATAWHVLLFGVLIILAQMMLANIWPSGSFYYPPVSASTDFFLTAFDEFGDSARWMIGILAGIVFLLATSGLALLPVLVKPPFGRNLLLPSLGLELLLSAYFWLTSWSGLTLNDDYTLARGMAIANVLVAAVVICAALRWFRQPSAMRLRVLVYVHQLWLQTVWLMASFFIIPYSTSFA